MMPNAHTPSEEELEEALDDAASGKLTSDLGFNDAVYAVLQRVQDQGYVDRVDEEEARRLRQDMEDAENIAEADAEEAANAAEQDPTTIR